MDFKLFEAAALFVLWLIQFVVPNIRAEITWVYGFWALIETIRMIINFKQRNAFHCFLAMCREHFGRETH